MNAESKQILVANYRDLLAKHRSGPEASQWTPEGQRYRFERLTKVGTFEGKTVLDVGCGLGDFYTYLSKTFGRVTYTGLDIVPEVVEAARAAHPDAAFHCLDLTEQALDSRFDYVVISGIFNNLIPDSDAFIRSMIRAAFARCDLGLAFNFISTQTTYRDDYIAYHDPVALLDFCLRELSVKVDFFHAYERRDVSVFVYR